MSEQFPEMLVGAGTVLTTEQVDHAMNAGAKFIVSPGLNPKVVKFIPAEAAGGLSMIKSMAAPYTKMKFMPTGGINAKNLTDYLDFKKIIACAGSLIEIILFILSIFSF